MKEAAIAITGANGFIGNYLLTELKAAGQPVFGITRSGLDDTRAVGDLGDKPQWEKCLHGVDTVVHCAAVAHRPLTDDAKEIEYLYRVNVKAVETLANACLRMGVRRLIFLSSVKVYGESTAERPPFQEADSLAPEDHYGRSKQQAETIFDGYFDRGLQICSLRLPLVYGPDAKANFLKLKKLAVSGLPLPLGAIINKRSLLGIQNLKTVTEKLLDQPNWPYRKLNVADPEPISVPNLVRLVARSQGKKSRLFPVPVSILRFGAKLTGRTNVIDRLAGDLVMDTSRLDQVLPSANLINTESCLIAEQTRKHKQTLTNLRRQTSHVESSRF